jgi:hypothetical protein
MKSTTKYGLRPKFPLSLREAWDEKLVGDRDIEINNDTSS